MIKLFKKLVDWCYATPVYKEEVAVDNKFYIPANQVFCFTKAKEKVTAQSNKRR